VRAERNEAHATASSRATFRARVRARRADAHGALQVLASFDKPDPLDGPFFEETIYVTAGRGRRHAARDRRRRWPAPPRRSACATARSTPSAAVNPEGVLRAQAAARPIGGLCARALRFQSALSNLQSANLPRELLLRHAWAKPCVSARELPVRIDDDSIPKRGSTAASAARRRRRRLRITNIQITCEAGSVLVPLPKARAISGSSSRAPRAPARGAGAAGRARALAFHDRCALHLVHG